VRWKTFSRSRL